MNKLLKILKEFIQKNNPEHLLILTPSNYGRLSSKELKKLTKIRDKINTKLKVNDE